MEKFPNSESEKKVNIKSIYKDCGQSQIEGLMDKVASECYRLKINTSNEIIPLLSEWIEEYKNSFMRIPKMKERTIMSKIIEKRLNRKSDSRKEKLTPPPNSATSRPDYPEQMNLFE